MMTIRSALVATDFSASSDSATNRAAGIAGETGLHGTLIHVLPGTLPAEFHLHAAAQAQRALAIVAEGLEQQGLHFAPRLVSGAVSGELARAAAEFDMVIAGARGEDLLLDFELGRTSNRLVRQSTRPTLIVKRPADRPYRRVLAAVDFSEPSRAAALCGAQVAPQADLDLVHAFEVEFESAMHRGGVDQDKIEAYRGRAREQAMAAMNDFSGSLGLPPEHIWPWVMHGYPPKVILDRAKQMGAQLIVMGKRAAGILEQALVGSVALEVLRDAECDVLVVPEEAASPWQAKRT